MRRALLVLALSLASCEAASPEADAARPADAAVRADASRPDGGGARIDGDVDAGDVDAGDVDAGDAGEDAATPRTTPIALADAWVAGWYGAGPRGINLYSHVSTPGAPDGYYVSWLDDPGATAFASVTDCSSFSDVLMMRAYGWEPPTTHSRPLAEDYYWAIRLGDHFRAIELASEIEVGDTIAALYGSSDSGGDTGHVAWVDAVPEPYAGAPDEPGLTQLAVTIVDSSHGFHYAPSSDTEHQDDRYLGPLPSGAECTSDEECVAAFGASAVCNTWTLSRTTCSYTGVGRGRMRLYVDASGRIAGYTWSTNSGSTFYGRPSPLPAPEGSFTGRDVVVGRYVPE